MLVLLGAMHFASSDDLEQFNYRKATQMKSYTSKCTNLLRTNRPLAVMDIFIV